MYDREDEKNLIDVLKIVLYFANSTSKKLYKTKLNKLLFYSQFLYYKIFKQRLIKDDFIRDYHGPTIPDLDQYLMLFSDLGFIELNATAYGTVIIPKVNINGSEYDERELDILKRILYKFDTYTASDISDYSHKEPLWEEASLKSVINVEEAYRLNDLQV